MNTKSKFTNKYCPVFEKINFEVMLHIAVEILFDYDEQLSTVLILTCRIKRTAVNLSEVPTIS
jgi:hypothetical protein